MGTQFVSENEGYRQLACAVLHQAMRHWRSYSNDKKPTSKVSEDLFKMAWAEGHATPHDELLAFFDSDWCKFLCNTIPVQYAAYRRRALEIGG